jgi:hypothetical protein
MRRAASLLCVLGLLFASLFVSSCGGGNSAPPPIAVALTPSAQQLIDQGQSKNITATVSNDSMAKGVTWAVSGASCTGAACGTLTNSTTTSVTYNAPATVSANLTVTLTATSVADTTKSASVAIVVSPPPAVTTTTLPDGSVGTAYSSTLQASGGAGALTWSLSAGTLPAGLTLSAAGVISGTPTTQGNSTFTVQVTDAGSPPVSATKQLTLTINPAPLTVTTTSLPNGTVSSAYSATLVSSGGTAPVTWSITVGTLPAGLALNPANGAITGTPTTAGTSTFTVQATDSATPTAQTATQGLSITVNPAGVNNSLLKGRYAFLLSGFDANGLVQLAGSFVADGAGNLSSGVEDINSRTAVSNPTFTGTYSIGADNRGTLTLTNAQGTFTYALALGSVNAGVAAKGRMITFDASGTNVSGTLQQQDPAAFSNAGVTGSFAFGAEGADSGTGQFGVAGRFTSNGAGGINSGLIDVNDGGTLISGATFTGTYSVAANGRGTAQFVVVGAAQPVNLAFYVVSATKLFIVGTDPVSSGGSQFAGQVEQQVGAGTFSLASLNGKVVLAEQGTTGAGASVLAGLVTGDGAGHITFSLDQNAGGTVSTVSGTGTYTVAATGRVSILPQGQTDPTLVYLASAGKGFVLETDTSAETGSIEPQTGGPTFTNASLNGAFFFGPEPPHDTGAELNSGVVTLDGAGNLSGTNDSNANGTLTANQPFTDTYTVAANGRVTFGSGGSALYIISPGKAVLIELNATNTHPTIQVVEK